MKIGGSLCSSPALPAVMRHLARQARRRRLLVVPGGGPFADAVRRAWKRRGLGLAAAHRMALLAMDQYGLLLCDLEKRAVAAADPARARRVARAGKLPVFLAAERVSAARDLPASWDVTSDSVAAWTARREGAARLVLVKSVPVRGARRVAREEFAALARGGIVDRYFERALPRALECYIADGRRGRVPIPGEPAPARRRAQRSRSPAGSSPRRRRRARR